MRLPCLLLTSLCIGGLVSAARAQTTTPPASQTTQSRSPVGYDAQVNLNALAGATGNGNGVVRSFDNRYEGVKGSPFWVDQWLPGEVELNNGNKITNVQIKFDALGHMLYLKTPRNDSVKLGEAFVKRFTAKQDDAPQTFQRLSNAGDALKTKLVRVVYEGKYSLAELIQKNMQKADFKGAYSSNVRYDEIYAENAYYLIRPDGTSEKVKLNKKSIIGALGDAAGPKVDEYAKTNKLDFKNESDLVKALTFASGL